jgi:hypothetical protein
MEGNGIKAIIVTFVEIQLVKTAFRNRFAKHLTVAEAC